MKKNFYRFIFLLALLTALPVNAQVWRSKYETSLHKGDNYHFGYVSGSVGYSMIQTSLPKVNPKGDVGGSFGLGYEFRNSGLWVNMGLQFSFHRSSLTLDETYTCEFPGYDTQGKQVTLVYRMDKQTDELQWNYLDVPLLIGYYYSGFYIGAGVKLSYAMKPTTVSRGTFNLSGRYEEGYTFSDMPDHGYTDYEFTSRTENRLRVSGAVIGEIGYDLLSSMPNSERLCHVLKLGFYFEYGLNNQLRGWDLPQPRIEPEGDIRPTPAASIHVNPYINTLKEPEKTLPFFTGVKLTYMIGGSRTARAGFHHGCMCYN